MITFLSHFFIKDYKDYNSPQVRQSYGMLCGAVGIALNIFLFIGKWLAGILSGSIAITADAFNNLSDAGSSGGLQALRTKTGYRASLWTWTHGIYLRTSCLSCDSDHGLRADPLLH